MKPSAVEVVTREYESNHGATPRGAGQWGFCTVSTRTIDYLSNVIWVCGTYGAAKKAARKIAAERGNGVLYVCP